MAPRMTTASLPPGLVTRVYLRSLALQASWNDERMQNLGLLVALAPWLRRQDLEVASRRRFCQRHLGVFNTNPYLANLVIGGLLRLEAEDSREGRTPDDDQRRGLPGHAGAGLRIAWRSAILAGTASGSGDVDHPPRPLRAVAALLAVVALFGVGELLARGRWLVAGYALGLDIVDLLSRPVWHRAIRWTTRVALALTGVLAGVYIAGILDVNGLGASAWRPAAAVGVGFALPLVLRQRLTGEAQALVGLLLLLGAVLLFD